MKAQNSFSVAGYIATEPEVRNLTNSRKARFAISVGRKDNAGGTTTRVSALMNIEAFRKNDADFSDFSDITKHRFVNVSGFFKPECWTDKDGKQRERIVMVATDISDVEADPKPE